MINTFDVKHLKDVLRFAGRKIGGTKQNIKSRIYKLIKNQPSVEISNKIREIFR